MIWHIKKQATNVGPAWGPARVPGPAGGPARLGARPGWRTRPGWGPGPNRAKQAQGFKTRIISKFV